MAPTYELAFVKHHGAGKEWMRGTWWMILAWWDWRPGVVLALVTLASVYASGWSRLREAGYARLARRWRLVLYLSGVASLAVALLSPIDELAHLTLSAHMVQHLLLMMVAAH